MMLFLWLVDWWSAGPARDLFLPFMIGNAAKRQQAVVAGFKNGTPGS